MVLPNPCAALQVQLMGLGFRLREIKSGSLPSDEAFPLKMDAKIFGRHSISLCCDPPCISLYRFYLWKIGFSIYYGYSEWKCRSVTLCGANHFAPNDSEAAAQMK
ncbi:hypothetical protein CEXT_617051 [Caerostris extrusa]|uniref:Uncharacterized protein n=1 Tax=Caerostris extrusa TaxID=172846 RepID=A0AAV4XTN5_CAEEX|nr:hypothetical protein CEXT_617051 [Caerostris extrusa]